MGAAAIVCVKCGAVSPTAVPDCAKCGGRNQRVCGGCGFQNSLTKNYCDKCGSPVGQLDASVVPPQRTGPLGAPPSDIPATVIRRGNDKPAGAPAPIPAAKSAAEPSFDSPWDSAPLPSVSREIAAERTAGAMILRVLRGAVKLIAGMVGVAAVLGGAWYWLESQRPEVQAPKAAAAYLDALKLREFPKAYAMFSVAAKRSCAIDEFAASRDTTTWNWSDLKLVHLEPGAALFSYRLAVEGAEPREDRVLFVQEGREWVRPYNWTLMRKVEEAFDKGNPDMGLVLAQAAAVIDPRDPMARGYLCEAAYYRKVPQEAVNQCEQAVALARTYPSKLTLKSLYHLHAILADSYKNALDAPEKALEQYATMLSFPDISPADQCSILLARAELYLKRSDPGRALGDLNRSDELCDKPADKEYIVKLRRFLPAR